MNKAIFIVSALAVVQTISATEVKVCGTGAVDKSSTTIEGCDKPPCRIKMGSWVNFSVKFTLNSPVSDLTAVIGAHSTVLFISRTDTFLHASTYGKIFEASDNSPAPCPLRPGVEYIYKNRIYIKNFLISISGTVEGYLKYKSKIIKCIEFAAELV